MEYFIAAEYYYQAELVGYGGGAFLVSEGDATDAYRTICEHLSKTASQLYPNYQIDIKVTAFNRL